MEIGDTLEYICAKEERACTIANTTKERKRKTEITILVIDNVCESVLSFSSQMLRIVLGKWELSNTNQQAGYRVTLPRHTHRFVVGQYLHAGKP